jgi:hypothetical protein
MMRWLPEARAAEYIVYRGTSTSGPWKELFRDSDIEIGGSKIDLTPDAKKWIFATGWTP